jgi:hypothetical protein
VTGGSLPGDPFVRFLRVVDLPSPWAVSDVGAPAIPAWATENAGALTLVSAGTHIAGALDQCGLLSVPISGDVQITAQLTSLSALGVSVRAGLMLRDGPGAGARGVCLLSGPLTSNTGSFVARNPAQSSATDSSVSFAAGPRWLRLVRFGNTFSAYASTNGASWTLLGSTTVPMNSVVEAGLAAASGTADTPTEAVFQSVLIEPLGASYVEWQSWVFGLRGITNAAQTDPGMDPDNDERSNRAEFFLGSDPLAPDMVPAVRVAGFSSGPFFHVRFTERKNAADFGRQFWRSADLREWSEVVPASITDLEDMGGRVVREVTFPVLTTTGFYRSSYGP